MFKNVFRDLTHPKLVKPKALVADLLLGPSGGRGGTVSGSTGRRLGFRV